MARSQGVNSDGELLSSMYVKHDPVPHEQEDDGRTRQEFADECDINILLARYEKTGVINHYSSGKPEYIDLSIYPGDLAGAMLVMDAANEAFMRLPATIRREFDNDAVQFADFAADAANLDKMREWGLAPPKAAPEPPKAEPAVSSGSTPAA